MPADAIAAWHSRGDKWIARLDRTDGGYSLRSFKSGAEVGSAFRPTSLLATDGAAIEWATTQVRTSFDVRLSREY